MEQKEMMAVVAHIHNSLLDINVHGDDAIRMGDVLKFCRNIVAKLQQQAEPAKEDGLELGE